MKSWTEIDPLFTKTENYEGREVEIVNPELISLTREVIGDNVLERMDPSWQYGDSEENAKWIADWIMQIIIDFSGLKAVWDHSCKEFHYAFIELEDVRISNNPQELWKFL